MSKNNNHSFWTKIRMHTGLNKAVSEQLYQIKHLPLTKRRKDIIRK